MKRQQVSVILSCMIMVSHCEEATCGSGENPKKMSGTVEGHLKSTMRTLWQDELAKEVKELINAKDEKITGLEGKVEQLEEKNEELEGLIEQLEGLIEQLQVRKKSCFFSLLFILLYLCVSTHESIYFQKGQRKVFFVAYTSGGVSIDSNKVITFNRIDANEGEGFNEESGRFRAPVGGTYEFDFSGYTNDLTSQTRVHVYKDGSPHFSCINGKEGSFANEFECTLMRKLSPGEEVYLKAITGKLRFGRFSGILLKADD